MRLFRIQSQDLPCDLAIRDHQRRNGTRAQPAHGLKPVTAIRCPKASFRRDHRNDRVEKAAGFVNDVGQSFVMRVREVALEGRRLYRIDGKNG